MKRQQTYKGLIGKGWYDQSEFSHRYACWANHRNNWAIRKADNRKLDDKPEYISTGLRVLDNNLHLVPGNFVVIGGRPSAGKTALSLQLACEIAKNGRKVAYFSLRDRPGHALCSYHCKPARRTASHGQKQDRQH